MAAMTVYDAARDGDVGALRSFIARGANMSEKFVEGRTPLHVASITGQGAAVDLLLEAGADIDAQDKFGWTALVFALYYGHTRICESLLSRGAALDVENEMQYSLLHAASRGGCTTIAKRLLQSGVDHDARDKHGNTSLHSAARAGKPESVRLLLKFGANPSSVNGAGQTALDWAIIAAANKQYSPSRRAGCAEVVELLKNPEAAIAAATVVKQQLPPRPARPTTNLPEPSVVQRPNKPPPKRPSGPPGGVPVRPAKPAKPPRSSTPKSTGRPLPRLPKDESLPSTPPPVQPPRPSGYEAGDTESTRTLAGVNGPPRPSSAMRSNESVLTGPPPPPRPRRVGEVSAAQAAAESLGSVELPLSQQFASVKMDGELDLPDEITDEPDWENIVSEQCVQYKCLAPDAIQEMREPLEIRQSSRVLKIHTEAFGAGTMRAAYPAMDVTTEGGHMKVVIKISIDHPEDAESYFADLETQAVARKLGEEFNHLGPPKSIFFTQPNVVLLTDRQPNLYAAMERHIAGKYVKYTNNWGYVNAEAYHATLDAFTHWTFHVTNGYMMVTDLQGVNYTLTDPAVHCEDEDRFGDGNMGVEGMTKYFQSHYCNDVCRMLRLPRDPRQPLEASPHFAMTVVNRR